MKLEMTPDKIQEYIVEFYKLLKREVLREFIKGYCAEHGLSAEAEGEEE